MFLIHEHTNPTGKSSEGIEKDEAKTIWFQIPNQEERQFLHLAGVGAKPRSFPREDLLDPLGRQPDWNLFYCHVIQVFQRVILI